jgi:hypothetical protein
MKQFTRDEIIGAYNKLPASRQVPILWDALGLMQGYNGRSRIDCIIHAMGYRCSDERERLYVPEDGATPIK